MKNGAQSETGSCVPKQSRAAVVLRGRTVFLTFLEKVIRLSTPDPEMPQHQNRIHEKAQSGSFVCTNGHTVTGSKGLPASIFGIISCFQKFGVSPKVMFRVKTYFPFNELQSLLSNK